MTYIAKGWTLGGWLGRNEIITQQAEVPYSGGSCDSITWSGEAPIVCQSIGWKWVGSPEIHSHFFYWMEASVNSMCHFEFVILSGVEARDAPPQTARCQLHMHSHTKPIKKWQYISIPCHLVQSSCLHPAEPETAASSNSRIHLLPKGIPWMLSPGATSTALIYIQSDTSHTCDITWQSHVFFGWTSKLKSKFNLYSSSVNWFFLRFTDPAWLWWTYSWHHGPHSSWYCAAQALPHDPAWPLHELACASLGLWSSRHLALSFMQGCRHSLEIHLYSNI